MEWRKRAKRKCKMRNEARMSFRISGIDSIPVAIPVWRRPVGFRASAAAPLLSRHANGYAHYGDHSTRVTHFSISLIGIFALIHERKSSGRLPSKLFNRRGILVAPAKKFSG